MIGLFKTEVIRHAGPWKGIDDVEFATLEWVHWFNDERLLEPLGYLPPAEYEKQFAFAQAAPVAALLLKPPSLRRTRGDSVSNRA